MDCHAIHDYAASKCPLQECDACKELEELDAEIEDLQDRLIALARRRWSLKTKVNTRHDQILRHLPTEIVTEIFLLVADSLRDASSLRWDRPPLGYYSCPPLYLGAVCKEWRGITLGMPLLWNNLSINAWSQKSHLSIMEEWLRRSSTAPLAVAYHGEHLWGPSGSTKARPAPRLIQLLRHHAPRWDHITFSGPWKSFHELMHNSDITTPVDTLDIHIFIENTSSMEPVSLKSPLNPRFLTVCATPINKIPLEWSRLTRLHATSMHLDEVMHILTNGCNLLECVIKDVVGNKSIYPLPTSPFVHKSIYMMTLGSPDLENSDVLYYLTLPSLQILDYEAQHDLVLPTTLVSFLERSRAPIHTFRFKYTLGSLDIPWYDCLPGITHLELGIYGYNDALHASERFLEALSRASNPLTLPHLRELRMYMHSIPKSFWSTLRDICKDSQYGSRASATFDSTSAVSQDDAGVQLQLDPGDQPQHQHQHQPQPQPQPQASSSSSFSTSTCTPPPAPVCTVQRRPLDSVYIQHLAQHWREMTEDDVIQQMLDTKASGIRCLEVKDNHGNDLITSAINVSTSRHLPFSRKFARRNSTWDGWPSDSDS
ncbi:hypothetical protein JR316_0008770 [Psilocybe cubensis]|uniref:F-box domain-containing protein n=2 Tax=Psilocybe cubensis TaxID=181762 RepID=A0A8H7XYD1_PSICU|nr:hypothetical protein JR316_0008770 [Psilocybe cubensis]KAH9478317.1 hypothetical protein JR316_0008770 [Psilocybe cubensis]